ncbi:MAG: hypothetical protein Q9217_004124 [Psora testacea]
MAQNSMKQPAAVKRSAGRPRKTAKTPQAPTSNGAAKPDRKRKNDNEASSAPPPAKRARATKASAPKVAKPKIVINERPAQRLDVYVFGEGSNSELGLGAAKNAIDVKRPRLNPLLPSGDLGVVSLACGGMHALALTHDGKVLTWGVNDNGALGRDTTWEGGLRDIDDEKSDDSDDSDSGLNPRESTPNAVSSFPEGTNIVKVAAGDSVSLALTDDGQVYGWGTFRVSQLPSCSHETQLIRLQNQSGVLGFYQDPNTTSRRGKTASNPAHLIETQYTPRLYTELAKITDIVCGSNHCMALTTTGQIYIWGCGEQNQLGHHINERIDVEGKACLVPSLLRTGRRKYKAIYTGADHAFAVDEKDQVWSWGLNSFGATGIAEGAGEDRASVYVPSLVNSLSDATNPVIFMCGGQHHSIAINRSGTALVFGRLDGLQTGLDIATISTSSIIYDENTPPRPRILIDPTPIPTVGTAIYASAGVDHSIIVNAEGKAWSWGISVNYQTGLGTTEDVRHPTMIDNTAVRGKKLIWSGCGGQFSMLAAPAVLANGVNGDVEMGSA